ncbi:MAG TPA: tetratricopeptide repeat protein [Thermoanaerobaculia bacterium]
MIAAILLAAALAPHVAPHADDAQSLSKACDNGVFSSCYALGLTLVQGEKPKDPLRAIALFTKACDGKFADGCDALGIAFKDGIGVEKDLARADSLFAKACDADSAAACAHLAHLRAKGDPANIAGVMPLFQKSCSGGFGPGCYVIGIAYYEGTGVSKDLLHAVIFFKKACDARTTDGCAGLGAIYSRDPQAAKDLFKKACAQIGGCEDFDALVTGFEAGAAIRKQHGH